MANKRAEQWNRAEDERLLASSSYDDYQNRGGKRTAAACVSRRYNMRHGKTWVDPAGVPAWPRGGAQTWPRVEQRDSGRVHIGEPESGLESELDSELEPPTTDDERLWDEYFELREASILKYLEITDRDDKRVTWKSPDDLPVGVCLCSDQHYGGFIRIDLLKRDIEVIANTEGLYAIGGGDWMDNFKPVGKTATGLFSASDPNPGHQYRRMVRLLKPSAGKWLVVMAGNHDDGWDMRSAGIARVPDLAKELDAPYASEAGCTLHLEVGWQRYTFFAKHTFRGTSGLNKGNAARNMWNDWPWAWENADVVCLSHLHENHMETVTRHGRDVVYMRSGTYKSGTGTDGYAETKGYRPEWGVPMVILFPKERKILPFKGQDFMEGVETLRMWRERYRAGVA